MALLDRILGTEAPKIPAHQFVAALAEYKRGEVTGAQVATAFGLSQPEIAALGNWLSRLDNNSINREIVDDVLMLGEAGYYTKAQVQNRLGV